MLYEVLASDKVSVFLSTLSIKSKNIITKNLSKLSSPYPGRGSGDKEKLVISGEILYRLHIGRSYTAFYILDEENKLVRVIEVLTIEAAHKKYGF